MRVAVVNITGGALSGGYAKYLNEMVPRLASHPQVRALTAFIPPTAAATLSLGATVAWPADDQKRGSPWLRGAIRAFRPDVVFIPTARWITTGVPTVCMVQNMEPLVRPAGGNPPHETTRNLARAAAAFVATRRASRVIAVSQFVRDYLVRRFRVPAERVGVVPVGSRAISTRTEPDGAGGWGRFAFTAGSIRPARGLEDAILGFAQSVKARQSLKLVIAGGGAGENPRYRQKMVDLGLQHSIDIIWAGSLTPSEMAWAYEQCFCFLMTSRVEACPNIVLEALTYGAPSISTDSPPMPEFFGDGAWYYPSGRSAVLGSRLDAMLSDGVGREMVSANARSRASQYSWEATTEGTVRELSAALAGS